MAAISFFTNGESSSQRAYDIQCLICFFLAEKRGSQSCSLEENLDPFFVFPVDAERASQERMRGGFYPDHHELTRMGFRGDDRRFQREEVIIFPAFFVDDPRLRVFDHEAFLHKKITESHLDSNKNFDKELLFLLIIRGNQGYVPNFSDWLCVR
jgi:hypothetical protein